MVKRVTDSIKLLLRRLLKQLNIELIAKQETEQFLNPFIIYTSLEKRIVLPSVPNQDNSRTPVFRHTEAVTQPSYVWQYQPGERKTQQLRYGAVRTEGKILATDFELYHILKNFISSKKRTVIEQSLVIVPWTHYLDGISFGGYYDFVILVAAKLCRIREALPASTFLQAVVSYPLFNTSYEQEYLSLIGFTPERIFDSRLYELRFQECILSNSGHWFYPDPADITALKKYIEPAITVERTERTRIYISRANRRRVINEPALITLLKKYNFTIIEDKPRSVAEQVALYKNASFIIGPHGASFTNIIWCEPGTHLFELFSANMVVEHFLYLAQIMNMSYTAYHHMITLNDRQHHLEEDIFVSIADLERSLDTLLETVP